MPAKADADELPALRAEVTALRQELAAVRSQHRLECGSSSSVDELEAVEACDLPPAATREASSSKISGKGKMSMSVLQLEGDARGHIDWLQPSPSCTGARNMLSASLTCPTATADRAVGHMCRCAEASAHHWLAHDDGRHVAAVGITPTDMIVQWLELNRACAQPPAPHAHIAPLEG